MSDPPPPAPVARSPRALSRGATAALAAALLAVGIVVGAAIGPAPQPSLAGPVDAGRLFQTLSALGVLPGVGASAPGTRAAAVGAGAMGGSSAGAAPTSAPARPRSPIAGRRAGSSLLEASAAGAPAGAPAGSSTGSSSTGSSSESAPSAAAGPGPGSGPAPSSTTGGGRGQTPASSRRLPAIAHVWLIALSTPTLAGALAQPSADPYLTGQLARQGESLTAYSPLAASELAADATLLSGQSAPGVSWIVQPACQEGAGAPCAPGSPADLAAADGFLREVVPGLMASTEYAGHGAIAIVFGAQAGASQGAAGATPGTAGAAPTTTTTPGLAATLTGQPTGAVLLSPFVRPGARSSNTFNPLSPRKSLEGLFR